MDCIYFHALEKQRLETVKYFLDRGTDPNVKPRGKYPSPLLFAVSHNIPLTTLILDHKVNLDENEEVGDALNDAARTNNLEMLELLISRGAPVDARGPDGWTSLSSAVLVEGVKAVQYLLRQGADVCVVQWPGMQPLHLAASTGNTEIAALLLDYGADINGPGIDAARRPTASGKSFRQRDSRSL